MKKINLILCAIAATAFFASCNNGTPKFNTYTSESYTNKYTVSGTYEQSIANKTADANGTAGTSDQTSWTKKSASAGYATITWNESKVLEGNMSDAYTITFDSLYGTSQSKTDVGATAGTYAPAEPNSQTILFDEQMVYNDNGYYYYTSRNLELYKIDDAFYYGNGNGELFKATVTGDLESGEDFTLALTFSSTSDSYNYLNPIASDSKLQNYTTTTKTYTLSFKNAK